MARGTISGVLWGAVVSAIGIFIAAFVVDPVQLSPGDDTVMTAGEERATAQEEPPAEPAPEMEQEGDEVVPPADEDVAEATPDPAPEPEPEPEPEPMPDADPVQEPEPEVAVTDDPVSEPDVDEAAEPDMADASDEPAPAPDVVEDSAQAPSVPEDGAAPDAAGEAPAPQAEETPGMAEAEPEPTPPSTETALDPAPEPDEEVIGALEPPEEDFPGSGPDAVEPPQPAPMPEDMAEPDAETPPEPDPAPEALPETVDETPERAEDPALIAEPEDTPRQSPNVVTNRLPSIGATSPEDPAPDTAQGPDADTLEDDIAEDGGPNASDGVSSVAPLPSAGSGRLPTIGEEGGADVPEEARPAIERNAIPYEGDPTLPKMAVVFLDEGPGREDVGDLGIMPFPLTVAVDASSQDAEAAVQFYRDSGAEIVLIVPLPEGATATDVDVTLQVYEPLLEQAVAVMFPNDSGFQTLGDAAKQVVTVLEEQGLGLVTYPEGLNTGHKTAVSEGVPATLVFRDLDADGQAPDVIRRFLDNVAFRARNEDGVTAVARVRPDSLQALLEWSLGNRAQTVNIAPLSATMME